MNDHKVCVYNYDQSGRTSKKTFVIHYKALFLYSPGGTEENNEKAVITARLVVTKRGLPVCQVRGWMFLNKYFVTKLYNRVRFSLYNMCHLL